MAGRRSPGIQSNHIVSTIKHYALNDQETGRMVLDASIDEAALRESDLLAFEIAIEQRPARLGDVRLQPASTASTPARTRSC